MKIQFGGVKGGILSTETEARVTHKGLRLHVFSWQ